MMWPLRIVYAVVMVSVVHLITAQNDASINCCDDVTNQNKCRMRYPSDCQDVKAVQGGCSGVYTIYVGPYREPVKVYCDMDTEPGAWTVFQRRFDGSEDFFRNWDDYENGFGEVYKEHWLGNRALHLLASQGNYTLRVDLADFEGETRYAEYTTFQVASHLDKYRLNVTGYTGNAGNGMGSCNGLMFSTMDQDNDVYSGNCASAYDGAWWYGRCHSSNLNGLYLVGEHESYADGINWYQWKGHHYSLKIAEMKLQRQ